MNVKIVKLIDRYCEAVRLINVGARKMGENPEVAMTDRRRVLAEFKRADKPGRAELLTEIVTLVNQAVKAGVVDGPSMKITPTKKRAA